MNSIKPPSNSFILQKNCLVRTYKEYKPLGGSSLRHASIGAQSEHERRLEVNGDDREDIQAMEKDACEDKRKRQPIRRASGGHAVGGREDDHRKARTDLEAQFPRFEIDILYLIFSLSLWHLVLSQWLRLCKSNDFNTEGGNSTKEKPS